MNDTFNLVLVDAYSKWPGILRVTIFRQENLGLPPQ